MDLLNKQVTSFENIKTLCANYKKDSIARKTADYLENRLTKLEREWVDFHERHEALKDAIQDKANVNYFSSEIYEKTKQLYESTKLNMMDLLVSHRDQQQYKQDFDLTGMLEEETDDNIKELMNCQESNFKALDRAMSKVNLEFISEKWEFEDHLATLKSKWDSVDKVHWQLETALKGSNLKAEYYRNFEDMELKYDHLRKLLNSKIWSNIHYQRSAPQINIPEFSGNYIQWLSFKDIFTETVHNNPTISKSQKMQHLKTKLRGEAERLVQHLSISAENYDSCWDILTHRYDNRRLQFTSFMNTMQQLPVIQTSNSYNLKKMHDVITESLNGLSNMGIEVSNWGPIVVYYMSQKMDAITFNEHTKEMKNNRDLPDISEFLAFLENKFIALETAKKCQKDLSNPSTSKQHPVSSTFNRNFLKSNYKNVPYNNYTYKNYNDKPTYYEKPTLHERNKNNSKIFYTAFGKCPLCEKEHVLMKCDNFINKTTMQRNNIVAKLNICKNCLFSHGNSICTSTKTCKECNLKHHTLLHYTEPTSKKENITSTFNSQPSTSKEQSFHHLSTDDLEVLLTTVQVKVQTIDGTYITLRALLDQGSQANLMTENAAQQLKLPRTKLNATISGIGSASKECKGRMKLNCQSIHSNYNFNIEALVLNQLTNNLPSRTFTQNNWPHIQNLKLANPDYNVSSSIDLLLGADVYADIIQEGVLKGDSQSPIAQQTQLGWILCGKLKTFNCHVTIVDLTEINKYWETEDITQGQDDINRDDQCEIHYQQTTRRTTDGKYIVNMPMVPNFNEKLGKSLTYATSQFLQLEKRLERHNKLATMYKDFIKEYYELQHMKPASQVTSSASPCYLPHHGVLREDSSTTKLRVVFNASQITTSGNSLNSLMEKGPNLQQDLQALILKWRTYKYVFTADIEKMYRCIWIDENQQRLQTIIWRNTPEESLQEYALSTVTYGTKCAPWLAMRTLKQLARDDGYMYPEAAIILQNEFYVDDLISGNNSLEKAKYLQSTLIKLLQGGGMNLRKWSSNNSELISHLNDDQISKSTYNFKQEESMKTLGLGWNPHMDIFIFNWNIKENSKKQLTKRTMLSEISQLYDPLGWFSPVTITAKLIFQRVWTEKLQWDEPLPEEIQNRWLKLKTELSQLETMKINRWIGSTDKNIELLGFCDASEKAYSCVIYTRVKDEAGQTVITLLAAKTRVAPIAQKTTLPRLELCGALLLSQLMKKVIETLKDYNITSWAWSDSKVVLAWLQGETSKWERFVENRVTKIRKVLPASQWSYIETKNNPADCATRGLYPNKLLNFELWWKGPTLLTNLKNEQACSNICLFTTNVEEKQKVTTLKPNDDNVINYLLNKHSTLTRAKRVLAWIMRFITMARKKTIPTKLDADKTTPNYLTIGELNASNKMFIKYEQSSVYGTEINLLSKNRDISTKSTIYKLNPFMDLEGIMRVGGRLNKTILPNNMKNPVILSRNRRFTKLLIEQAHISTLHGGARLTLAYIRQHYWIVGGNRAVKTQLRRCVRCHRFKTQKNYQLMADLPAYRVAPCRPFTHTGVDFTGHVELKLNKGRGVKTSKGYIAIFVCMTTKAVHIELVSDLSTETFLAAFQRMCGRRGTPKHVYSDCGTNFIGAAKVLHNEYELFKKELPSDFFDEINKLEVEWHFNAPAWPTAGGLWEAAVRSMKHHLRRVLGDQKLTYEEFSTLLTKIEACMNSRPLCPLSEDPEEFNNYLTPGHFLTGSPTMTLPISNYEDDRKLTLRNRWQLTEHMMNQFWKTWSSDYLTQLQTRTKWQKSSENLKKDDIVLVKDNNLPPGKWAMGRVIDVHPGSDGRVRVTTIKTQTGVIKRPITKLSPLPNNYETDYKNLIEEKKTQQLIKQNSSKTTSSKKTVIKTLFTYVTIFLSLLSCCCSVKGANVDVATAIHITSLGDNRPIYYDNVSNIQLIHDEWKLLMYFNLSTYWDGFQNMDVYLKNLNEVCKMLDPRYCVTTTQQLYHEYDLLKHYNNLLLVPRTHLMSRNKRGLVDGVGYIANSLFGILDQRFADKYIKDIQSIQTNEHHLLELIKNQTSIVKLENDILKKNEANIIQQFTVINNFMNQTDLRLSKVETEIEIVMAANYFSSTSLTAYLLLQNLKNMQEMLYSALVDVYQGHIDVHMLSPANLINQLTIISGRLPKTLTLPFENIRFEIKNIYKLLYAKARVTDKFFLLEVHIPLTSDEDYSLFYIIPLPLKINRTESAIVNVSSKYIAVNFRKNTYLNLNEDNLTRCTKHSHNGLICNLNIPIRNFEDSNAPCEAKLLSHHETSPCNVMKTTCEDKWIELHSSNTWLATCCDSCTLRTVCDDDVTTRAINTSAVISLRQGCLLQTKHLMIHSKNNYNSEATLNLDLKIPTSDLSINNMISTQQTPQLKLQTDENIKAIDEKLKYLEDKEQLPATVTVHDIHQYTICYLLLATAVVAVTLWIIKRRGWCIRRVKVTPAHEHQHSNADTELQPYCTSTIRRLFRSQSERGQTNKREAAAAAASRQEVRAQLPQIQRLPTPGIRHNDVQFNL